MQGLIGSTNLVPLVIIFGDHIEPGLAFGLEPRCKHFSVSVSQVTLIILIRG
jgi:hypothetical protein